MDKFDEITATIPITYTCETDHNMLGCRKQLPTETDMEHPESILVLHVRGTSITVLTRQLLECTLLSKNMGAGLAKICQRERHTAQGEGGGGGRLRSDIATCGIHKPWLIMENPTLPIHTPLKMPTLWKSGTQSRHKLLHDSNVPPPGL